MYTTAPNNADILWLPSYLQLIYLYTLSQLRVTPGGELLYKAAEMSIANMC